MNCNKHVDTISAYVDGEVTPEERVAMERHFASCSECSRRLASYRSLKHIVGRLQGRVSLPEPVDARIGGLRFRFGEQQWSKWIQWLTGALAATAAVLAVYLTFWVKASPERNTSLVHELVADHVRFGQSTMATEVASQDPSVVSRFFANRLDFDPYVPILAGADLIGGRVCTIAGSKSQLLFYRLGDRKLSLYVMNQPVDAVSQCRQVGQHHVCGRRHGPLSLVLVGDESDSALEELLKRAAL